MTLAIIVWAFVLVEFCVMSRYCYRDNRRRQERDREWRENPRAIPYRDLRREYKQ